jgi:hypothetical protein
LKRVEQVEFGKAPDGAEVKLITLRNSKVLNLSTLWID